jgi:hypothetical protein
MASAGLQGKPSLREQDFQEQNTIQKYTCQLHLTK